MDSPYITMGFDIQQQALFQHRKTAVARLARLAEKPILLDPLGGQGCKPTLSGALS